MRILKPSAGCPAVVLFFCLFCFSLPAFSSDKPHKPLIAASTTQIADFARQIAGDDFEVWSILGAGADPHTYVPTPKDARRVAMAEIAIENGLHLEGKNWMKTLAGDAGIPLVTATAGIDPIELENEKEAYFDPHAWFTPQNAAVYVNNILDALIAFDPEGKERYEARAELYLQELRVLDGWIRKQVNAIHPSRRVLVTNHDAFNYFCQAYRFLPRSPVGWSTGKEIGAGTTPERRKKVIQALKDEGVPAVFVETTINPEMIRELAREAGVKVGGELYSDSMGEDGSAGETYIGMMRENVLTIAAALKGGISS